MDYFDIFYLRSINPSGEAINIDLLKLFQKYPLLLDEPITIADYKFKSLFNSEKVGFIQNFMFIQDEYDFYRLPRPDLDNYRRFVDLIMTGMDQSIQTSILTELLLTEGWSLTKFQHIVNAVRCAMNPSFSSLSDQESLQTLYEEVVKKAFYDSGKVASWFRYSTVLRKSWVQLILRSSIDDDLFMVVCKDLSLYEIIQAYAPILTQYIFESLNQNSLPSYFSEKPNFRQESKFFTFFKEMYREILSMMMESPSGGQPMK